MKKINCITSLSPYKQYELRRWFLVTVLLYTVAFAVGAYFFIPQCMLYFSLRKDVKLLQQKTNDYTGLMGNKDALKKEYDELHLRENKLNNQKQQRKNPYQHVVEIVQASGDGVQIESIRFNKKEVEISLLCPTAEHAQVFIKRLGLSSHFSQSRMVSLQYDEQIKQMRCVIKGTVVV